MADMVPLEWMIIACMALGGLMMVFLFKWLSIRNQSESSEGVIYAKCRAEGKPCLNVVDISTGHARVYAGDKDEDGDPYFDIEGLPMKIDPSLCAGDCRPIRYGNGLNIWQYATPKALPLSVDAMLAYKTMTAHRRDKASFRLLDAIPDRELYSLIRISKKHVKDAAEILIAKYKIKKLVLPGEEKSVKIPGTDGHADEEDIEEPLMDHAEFVEIVDKMKAFFAALPIETGFYCTQAAFAAIPYAHSSQDVERIKYLLEQKAQQEIMNNNKLMQMGFMFVMVLGAIAVIIAILLTLGPHATATAA